jgi:hypothetical protein
MEFILLSWQHKGEPCLFGKTKELALVLYVNHFKHHLFLNKLGDMMPFDSETIQTMTQQSAVL